MMLLKLLRNVPPGYAGEVMGFDDDVAAKLVRTGKAAPVVKEAKPEPVAKADPKPVVDAAPKPEPKPEPKPVVALVKDEDPQEDAEADEPRRGPGRPRKI